jgi:hypothetical protein
MANAKLSWNEEQFIQQNKHDGCPWNVSQSWLQQLSCAPEIRMME